MKDICLILPLRILQSTVIVSTSLIVNNPRSICLLMQFLKCVFETENCGWCLCWLSRELCFTAHIMVLTLSSHNPGGENWLRWQNAFSFLHTSVCFKRDRRFNVKIKLTTQDIVMLESTNWFLGNFSLITKEIYYAPFSFLLYSKIPHDKTSKCNIMNDECNKERL